MPGVLRARSLACRMKQAYELATTGTPNDPDIPCAMVLTAYARALPRGTGLVSPRPPGLRHPGLGTSVGVPGPHDLAVRAGSARPAQPTRPSHPAPNTRDDREAPLLEVRDAEKEPYISAKRKTYIFTGRA